MAGQKQSPRRASYVTVSLMMAALVFVAGCSAQSLSATATPTSSRFPTPAPSAQSLQSRVIAPTPLCGSTLSATPAMTEGPFFKPNSPERLSLIEPGMAGTKIVVVGYVLASDCKPIVRALADFWQADDRGNYDNAGYRLRGHQFTDDAGRYYLETIVPGLYPGRTRHIHVKAQAPNRPALTTQLFFPGEPGNQTDAIFDRALLLSVQDTSAGKVATFNFVLGVR